MKKINIVFFGLSITSSWGNGHATTYRALTKALAKRGHRITFFERAVPWYAQNRDMHDSPYYTTVLYQNLAELDKYRDTLEQAELIVLGSFVQDAKTLAKCLKQLSPPCFAFYDIDTPVTLAKLENKDYEYLDPEMIPMFDVYLSFTGGPILKTLEQNYGARQARPLYCSVDTELYFPDWDPDEEKPYCMGYLGTYSDDRQDTLNELFIRSARHLPHVKFCIAGAQYPSSITWPANVQHSEHIPPSHHRRFYNTQNFTLNVTRKNMINAGYSPSVRLFEAAACGTPIITDKWTGLDTFFTIDKEILVAENCTDVLEYLAMGDSERRRIGERLSEKILKNHTSEHRALELESYWQEVTKQQSEKKSKLFAQQEYASLA